MKQLSALAAAAVAYLLAAWMVAPGFYDGFGPVQKYNWVCPPAVQAPYGNLPPSSGHLDIKVINGVSDASSAFTQDGQVVISFLPGAFDVTGKTSIAIDITPVSPCPKPSGLTFETNTYLITSTAPLVKDASLVTRYSDLVPAPSYVYFSKSVDGPWKQVNIAQQAAPFTVDTTTREFGYFAAGFPANATSHTGFNAQLIPIIVALLIAAVLIGGIPLAIVRRRRGGAVAEEEEEETEPAGH
jgi:hypothetical protein